MLFILSSTVDYGPACYWVNFTYQVNYMPRTLIYELDSGMA